MSGPVIATIEIRRIPLDDGYAFDVEYAGVPLEDHPLATATADVGYGAATITGGLRVIGTHLDEIEQAGP